MKLAIAGVGTLLGLATLHANPAQAAVVNFSGFSEGAVVTGATTAQGVTLNVSGQGNTGGQPRELMIFDSTCGGGIDDSNCTGNDDDLFFGNQFGNVLIISQNNNSASPNDSRRGGLITFTFPEPIFLKSFVYLDGDERRPAIFETFNGSTLVDSLSSVGAGDNEFITVDGFSNTKVTRLEVDLPGSGAIDDVTYAVPEPLTILGSSMALGFGALFKKQQSKKQKKN
ncbi:PEP-CTERM putative exosortase interaction domain protein [Coleofasciculus chthonoplastes PCC 7420]|uniref:PEP-CTERM putative exosortase interaction domain protein n=2 Tax=Coleofasciculus chthonoplastes TaxID=64178 RepID=B4W0L4_9CYAN|nr:PEP-CTERM putative exosortase interaction domain protein [Coleofasciculus chthonoplastes PCC 7420]